jgi:hypothetical protein
MRGTFRLVRLLNSSFRYAYQKVGYSTSENRSWLSVAKRRIEANF